MALESGSRLGSYEISSLLGKGGMGEVYRARDTKLGREVAIKVLPSEFSQDAERLARLEREARMLASLNHPNIGAIHGLEESDGTRFLVLELVEGATLADQIKRGAIPVEESLKLALQIAEALEAAHDKGVIHRDLKPANIKITPDGRVKVLDFGLAKAFEGEIGDMNLSNSPTLSMQATQQGVILGTAAYMSPEQARGHEVDRRADIWSFGCVLLEMLTGRPAFPGDDVTDILAAVVRAEPEWARLPDSVHPSVRNLIARCLAKDLRCRKQSIADVRADLETLPSRPEAPLSELANQMPVTRRQAAGLVGLGALVTAAITTFLLWNSSTPPPRTDHFDLAFPSEAPLALIGAATLGNGRQAFAISPDGTTVVYVGNEGGSYRLYVRTLDGHESRVLSGTENGYDPFFSPNGAWIGFFVNNELWRVQIDGGDPLFVAEATNSAGAAWLTDDRIIIGTDEGANLAIVPTQGGRTEVLAAEFGFLFPHRLPDDKHVLVSVYFEGERVIGVFDTESKETELLPIAGEEARHSNGFLFVTQGNTLQVARFDPDTLTLESSLVPVLTDLRVEIYGTGQWSLSDNGTLLYASGTSAGSNPFHWVSETQSELVGFPVQRRGSFEISPDGQQLAVLEQLAGVWDISIYDFGRMDPTRLTTGGKKEGPLSWMPDGESVVYQKFETTDYVSYRQFLDDVGTGEEPFLPAGYVDRNVSSLSADGQYLGVQASASAEIAVIDLSDESIVPIPTTGDVNWGTAISPDGLSVAYTSATSGVYHIYIQPVPPTGLRRQVSRIGGAEEPRWSPDGRKLYYRNGQRIMVASIATTPELVAGDPEIFFEGEFENIGGRSYDIHPDGQRALVIRGDNSANSIHVVTNWLRELDRLLGGSAASSQ